MDYKDKTLKQIMEEFGKVAYDCYLTDDNYKREIQAFLTQSIKDALEAVCVQKIRGIDDGKPEPDPYEEAGIEGYNQATTQYDENVKKFLGEE